MIYAAIGVGGLVCLMVGVVIGLWLADRVCVCKYREVRDL